ncbi:MAG: amino acid permease [Alphaproteobacteria bacterium 32-64-14]|nr:MAG: amino acid permease [Alphaproteobacteria bacterium 32-64-14]
MGIWTRKPIGSPDSHEGPRLRRTLGPVHLIALGVGAIVGTGIYTLIGVGADRAGPAVLISFGIAGLVCACVALCYGELASMMHASGGAYTYSYSALGELPAWVIGWALILEYSVVCAAVAVGWSGYADSFLTSVGVNLPPQLTAGPSEGGIINLPAVLILFAVAGLLCLGTRESAAVNSALVGLKIAALVLFIALALPAFNPAHFEPFMPHGFSPVTDANGVTYGVMGAAAIIFFAFYGFDAVATAAEETKNPARDLAIGIIGSMAICTFIYIAVALAAIGAMPPGDFAKSDEPLALIIRTLGHPELSAAIAGVAVIALPTVILAFLFGQSRIFFVMARDGLLPRRLGSINEKRGAPVFVVVVTAALVSILAGLLPLGDIAALANAGTLAAFAAVGASLLALRRREPDRPRPFRTPLAWVVAPFAIIGCIYLFISLPPATQIRFFIWMAIGLAVYGARYAMRKKPA